MIYWPASATRGHIDIFQSKSPHDDTDDKKPPVEQGS